MLRDFSHYVFRFHVQFVEALSSGIWFETFEHSIDNVELSANPRFLNMYYEVKDVQLELPRGEIVSAKFLIWEEAPEDSELVKVSLQFNSREITVTDHDYFSALCSIRRVLELEGGLLHCFGASRNVYPSPMSRDMGGGIKAYKLHLGSQAKLSDLVSIFDSGADMSPTTVDEQERFYKEWLASFC